MAMPAKSEDQAATQAEAPEKDSPLLDLSDAAVKRFIKTAKGAPYLRRAAPRLLELAARKCASGVTMEEILYNRSHERDEREAEGAAGGEASA